MSRRVGRKQEVCSASAQYGSLITEPNCLIRSETTRKPQCYTAPGQRPPSLTAGRVFSSYLGAGGRAKLPSGFAQCGPECCSRGGKGRRRGVSVQSLATCSARRRRAVGPEQAQTFCLLGTSGISVVSVGNMGGWWWSRGRLCIWSNYVVMAVSWKLSNRVCVRVSVCMRVCKLGRGITARFHTNEIVQI